MSTKLLIINGGLTETGNLDDKTHQRLQSSDAIVVTTHLLQRALTNLGKTSHLIFEQKLSYDYSVQIKRVDQALHEEATLQRDYRWAPLSARGIFYALMHYLQFKRRWEGYFSTRNFDQVVLSSGKDRILNLVLEEFAKKQKFELKIEDGSFEAYSALDAFAPANDLRFLAHVDPDWLVTITSKLRNVRNYELYVQPYWNLPHPSTAYPIRARDFCKVDRLIGGLKEKLFRQQKSGLRFDLQILQTSEVALKSNLWNFYSENERRVIASVLEQFKQETSNEVLDQLAHAIQIFFGDVRGKRLIVLDPFVPFSRLLIRNFRTGGAHVDFLPHGLTSEELFSSTDNEFCPHRVLAWNESSANRFNELGMNSEVIRHPHVSSPSLPLKDLRVGNVLVLTGSGDTFFNDRFERDALELTSVFADLPGWELHWKIHDSFPENLRKKHLLLQSVLKSAGITAQLVAPTSRVRDIVEKFELVIVCGPSTAIAEALEKGIPTFVYKGKDPHGGIYDGFKLPFLDTPEAVKNFLSTSQWRESKPAVEDFLLSLRSGKPVFKDNK